MTALQEGWQIANIVTRRRVQFPGARYTFIYVLVLARGRTLARMNVTHNPFVARVVAEAARQLEARVGSSPIKIVE